MFYLTCTGITLLQLVLPSYQVKLSKSSIQCCVYCSTIKSCERVTVLKRFDESNCSFDYENGNQDQESFSVFMKTNSFYQIKYNPDPKKIIRLPITTSKFTAYQGSMAVVESVLFAKRHIHTEEKTSFKSPRSPTATHDKFASLLQASTRASTKRTSRKPSSWRNDSNYLKTRSQVKTQRNSSTKTSSATSSALTTPSPSFSLSTASTVMEIPDQTEKPLRNTNTNSATNSLTSFLQPTKPTASTVMKNKDPREKAQITKHTNTSLSTKSTLTKSSPSPSFRLSTSTSDTTATVVEPNTNRTNNTHDDPERTSSVTNTFSTTETISTSRATTTATTCKPPRTLITQEVTCPDVRDCATLKDQKPHLSSGLYTINTGDTGEEFEAYCDMETAGGGWTVIQRRIDGKEDFFRTYDEYENGFGDLQREFWLGNKKIHRLVNYRTSELRFDLKDFENETRYAVYEPVFIADESDGYGIHIGTYTGTAGDSFRDADGCSFTTKDRDADSKLFDNCARTCKGGWWYSACHGANMNGEYKNIVSEAAISWKRWHGQDSLKSTEMKIRPVSRWKDCVGLMKDGKDSGIHIVNPHGSFTFKAYCNMSVDGGGWMVIQRRIDGTEDFYRPWADYSKGFGDPNREFWIGNNILHSLTKNRKYKLRFDLEDFDGNKRYAVYRNFEVESQYHNYQLSVEKYCGNAGDSLTFHTNQYFSTKDSDNDDAHFKECAVEFKGAWWYRNCHEINLNGLYNETGYGKGINWMKFTGFCYSLKFTEMKIRPQ